MAAFVEEVGCVEAGCVASRCLKLLPPTRTRQIDPGVRRIVGDFFGLHSWTESPQIFFFGRPNSWLT